MNMVTLLMANLKSAALFGLLFTFLYSCNPKTNNKPVHDRNGKNYSLVSPSTDRVYAVGDTVEFAISPVKRSVDPDSVRIVADGKLICTDTLSGFRCPVNLLSDKYGKRNIRIKVFFSDSLTQILPLRIIVLPDTPPENLNYKVIRTIRHDPGSFTQGLVFYDGYIYEGTGRQGKSKIMKIDPSEGKIILERKLGDNFFGEGIAIYNDKIYQLTYRSMLGFVYDLETFEQIREFDLQTSEGWGLATDEKSLIVSDGSSSLYFYDPVYLAQTNQLDVCDNKGLIGRLNELEYVDGCIWANVYGEKYILKIDAKNGRVLAKLDLHGIYPEDIPDNYEFVLNGIAFNPGTKTFYVTGKLWPVLYEIRILQ
ncbi:MAG: glutaminyl-peptide cyclotransferase, partial [Bacteroidales bacterium]|jgi:glutamine cyclotransferase